MIRRQAVGGPHPWPQTQHVDATPRHEYRARVAVDDLPLIGWRDVSVHARVLLDTLLRVPLDRTGSSRVCAAILDGPDHAFGEWRTLTLQRANPSGIRDSAGAQASRSMSARRSGCDASSTSCVPPSNIAPVNPGATVQPKSE